MKLSDIAIMPARAKSACASAVASAPARASRQAARQGPDRAFGVRIKGFEGGQMPLHRRLPKRGFTTSSGWNSRRSISTSPEAIDAKLLDASAPSRRIAGESPGDPAPRTGAAARPR